MCGVVGIVGKMNIAPALERLEHRGIRCRTMISEAGSIGHVRLPIVGLGEDHDQPLTNDNWLFGFVGELLNFRELHPGMECDTELAFDTWTKLGPPGFTHFDGFWGIVALHKQSRSLHVLTDYLGIKPMYYRNDYPAAASEPDALIPFGDVTLDEIYLSSVIKHGYCPDIARTPYNEIKHLPPGCYAILEKDSPPHLHRTDPLIPRGSLGAIATEMREAIEEAVKRRVLSSDVQTACLVSGGLDSAIVYTLAKRYGQPMPYFAYETHDIGKLSGELLDAMKVVPPAELIQIPYGGVSIKEALYVMQEPIDLGSLRPQIALAMGIKERVCLTGDGADEVFGGYGRSMRYDSQYSDLFEELPAWHLPRLDRVMMRNRVEMRSPFLGRKVVQLGLSLPHEMRKNKNFLRQLFSDILPPRICEMEKKPLRTPEIANDRELYSTQLVQMFKEERRWLR